MSDHITRYDLMPIPPIDAQTEYFDAGAVRFGVEYRLLTDAIAAASEIETAGGGDHAESFDDRGVSVHVFGLADDGGEPREFLRFDCFEEDPHYHYISWRERSNEMLHMDPVANGDSVAFALECIERRLPALLTRAGAVEAATEVEAVVLARVLPEIRDEAMRLRRAGAAETQGRTP